MYRKWTSPHLQSKIFHAFSSCDILSSSLSKPLPHHVDEIVAQYDRVLHELLDKHAPVKSRACAERSIQPWMNSSILDAKWTRRQCERRWRKSKLTVHRQAYKECCEEVRKRIKEAKSTYFVKQIEDCEKDQKKLFKIVDKLLGCGKSSVLPEYTTANSLAQTFNEFFI